MWAAVMSALLLGVALGDRACVMSKCVAPFGDAAVTVSVCGNDETDYDVVPGTADCLWKCNVTALWPGTCLCPGNCSGQPCTSQGCSCEAPWGGRDCSVLGTCEGAPCNHGSCETDQSGALFCNCEAGWTSSWCDVRTPSLQQVAFPLLFPDEPQYFDDCFGDSHPMFNLSTVATICLTMTDEDYAYIVDPQNSVNETKRPATVWFRNEVMSVTSAVGVSISGQSSRRSMWKNFNIKFDSGQYPVKGVDEIGLKSGSEDPSMMRNILAIDLCRAMSLPVQRFGFAQLYINDQSHGFYLVMERVNADFLKSRFPGPQSNVGLLKMPRIGGYLTYLGPNVSSYTSHYNVEMGDANATISTLINMIRSVSLSPNASWVDSVSIVFGLQQFIRYMVVELLAGNPDSITQRGNNYFLYQNDSQFSFFIPYDQEESFGTGYCEPACTRCNSSCWQRVAPGEFFTCLPFNSKCRPHPLSLHAWLLQQDVFVALYKRFVATVFAPLAPQRLAQYASVIGSALRGDHWYDLDWAGRAGFSQETFQKVDVATFADYLQGRAQMT